MSDLTTPIPFLYNRIPAVFLEWTPELDEEEDEDGEDESDDDY